MVQLLNIDCMEYMAGLPDKAFDLAIVDPPYGIGADWLKRNKGKKFQLTTYKNKSIPNRKYFKELFRVSKNQVIWGYNYYTRFLGPTNYLIVWDKVSNNNEVFKYSKAEIAFTSIRIPCNYVSIPWDGYRMGKETGQSKIHPHQKPIELYKWILKNYAKGCTNIIDTHLGSASSAIAAEHMGFDFVGCELDKDYYTSACKRFKEQTAQLKLL